MKESFITEIKAKNCPIVGDIEISLDKKRRKHLIITGKNGSGKTTFLKEMNKFFLRVLNKKFETQKTFLSRIDRYEKYIERYKQSNLELEKQHDASEKIGENQKEIEYRKKWIRDCEKDLEVIPKVESIFLNQAQFYEEALSGKFILAFFEAKRENKPYVPKSISNVNLNTSPTTETKTLHTKLIDYMVRLRMTYLDAKDKKEEDKSQQIDNWFKNFEKTLQNLFEREDLKLQYYNDELNFKIVYENRIFGFNELSDGYSSLIAILAELILRMESEGFKSYDMQGVVLIDEIETHLHIGLQKKVLPFLCDFFPKIQFIVTTHSPFVLSSLDNAIICDLERKIITQDLSAYSYDALIESYFDNDKYSGIIKEKVKKYEELSLKKNLEESEIKEKENLWKYIENTPKFYAEELETKISELRLERLLKKEK